MSTTKNDVATMIAKIADQEATIAKLTANQKAAPKTGVKTSEKGAVSVYGIRRFPITFYMNEWDKLRDLLTDDGVVTAHIAANKADLAIK